MEKEVKRKQLQQKVDTLKNSSAIHDQRVLAYQEQAQIKIASQLLNNIAPDTQSYTLMPLQAKSLAVKEKQLAVKDKQSLMEYEQQIHELNNTSEEMQQQVDMKKIMSYMFDSDKDKNMPTSVYDYLSEKEKQRVDKNYQRAVERYYASGADKRMDALEQQAKREREEAMMRTPEGVLFGKSGNLGQGLSKDAQAALFDVNHPNHRNVWNAMREYHKDKDSSSNMQQSYMASSSYKPNLQTREQKDPLMIEKQNQTCIEGESYLKLNPPKPYQIEGKKQLALPDSQTFHSNRRLPKGAEELLDMESRSVESEGMSLLETRMSRYI